MYIISIKAILFQTEKRNLANTIKAKRKIPCMYIISIKAILFQTDSKDSGYGAEVLNNRSKRKFVKFPEHHRSLDGDHGFNLRYENVKIIEQSKKFAFFTIHSIALAINGIDHIYNQEKRHSCIVYAIFG